MSIRRDCSKQSLTSRVAIDMLEQKVAVSCSVSLCKSVRALEKSYFQVEEESVGKYLSFMYELRIAIISLQICYWMGTEASGPLRIAGQSCWSSRRKS